VEHFETPLGQVKLDRDGMAAAQAFPFVTTSRAAHAREHSLEVQLPFLQVALEHFCLVPLLVGRASPTQVADVLEALWGGPETVLVVSSDLSHFHTHEQAQRLDAATAARVVALDTTIKGEDACGAHPLTGLLELAKRRGLTAHLLDLRNSGDTAGDKDRVVGYGAFALTGGTS
jgi:AmmeMemoRadiSam system protein B